LRCRSAASRRRRSWVAKVRRWSWRANAVIAKADPVRPRHDQINAMRGPESLALVTCQHRRFRAGFRWGSHGPAIVSRKVIFCDELHAHSRRFGFRTTMVVRHEKRKHARAWASRPRLELWTSMMAALDLLGQRWTLRVIWELQQQPAGFRDTTRRTTRCPPACWPSGSASWSTAASSPPTPRRIPTGPSSAVA